jgi:hypothetical protein
MSWALAWKGNPLMWTKCSEGVVPKSTVSGSFSDISLGNSERQNKNTVKDIETLKKVNRL